ncbi:hypothetical protein GTX14_13340 [Streptomyces sp. SID4944]|nr:hypothetical protein [Streptomyces sp. SID4944]
MGEGKLYSPVVVAYEPALPASTVPAGRPGGSFGAAPASAVRTCGGVGRRMPRPGPLPPP